MQDSQYRVLLDLMMMSDPWPLDEEDRLIFIKHMRNEAKARGFDDEIVAYHNFLQLQGEGPKPLPAKKRKPRKVRGKKTTTD